MEITPDSLPLGGPTHVVCHCERRHTARRIVLTGGPGAGKTAVLEMLAHLVCPHVAFTREAAGILFGGGFPRRSDDEARRAVQRAIFHVQLELESLAATTANPALVLCDRGIVDGCAYWPGPESFWDAVGVSRASALARYDAVIHLRSPSGTNGYDHQNPMRIETAAEARAIDERIFAAWDGHPRRFIIGATMDFVSKAAQAIALVLSEVPQCCRLLPDISVASPATHVDVGSDTTSTGQRAPCTTEPTTLPSSAGSTRPMP